MSGLVTANTVSYDLQPHSPAPDCAVVEGDRQRGQGVAEALLELGADREDYDQMLDDMGDALPIESGRADAVFFLELAETVADYGSPNPASCLRLWVRIVEGLRSIGSRLSEHEVALANDIGQVFGFDEAVPTAQKTASATVATGDLAGKMVAVYTLTESVSRHTRRYPDEALPGH